MNFEDFCKNEDNIKKAKTMENKIHGNSYDELLNKYKNKSSEELYSELIKVAGEQKAKGNLSKSQLNNIYNTISPLMNEKEKENLKKLIEIIG
ncbi:MAG: hypothetical protein E7359_02150 [Clostridiales bacterium]|nr:hypothetical protein [Clostridiales bacterium]